jgi:hypothetical protein
LVLIDAIPPTAQVSGPNLTHPKGTHAAGLSIAQAQGMPPVPIKGLTYRVNFPVIFSGISVLKLIPNGRLEKIISIETKIEIIIRRKFIIIFTTDLSISQV